VYYRDLAKVCGLHLGSNSIWWRTKILGRYAPQRASGPYILSRHEPLYLIGSATYEYYRMHGIYMKQDPKTW